MARIVGKVFNKTSVKIAECNKSSSAVRIVLDWIIFYDVFFVVGQDSFISAFMS